MNLLGTVGDLYCYSNNLSLLSYFYIIFNRFARQYNFINRVISEKS